jgi:SpoVK/Ycf46/Vps4 family AAA+-type ATPase
VHTGVVVLTSNRPSSLDEAFARRIRLSVRFDPPDHAQREEIWRRFLPDRLLDNRGDRAAAAREELSGGAIRSAAVAATVAAIAAGGRVRREHLDAAVRRELEKSRRQPTGRGVVP